MFSASGLLSTYRDLWGDTLEKRFRPVIALEDTRIISVQQNETDETYKVLLSNASNLDLRKMFILSGEQEDCLEQSGQRNTNGTPHQWRRKLQLSTSGPWDLYVFYKNQALHFTTKRRRFHGTAEIKNL